MIWKSRPTKEDAVDARPRLLLIEDDPELGPITQNVLDEVYDVTLETTGEGGYRTASQQSFEAIVVDRRLPGVNGIEVMKALRRDRIVTPILVLSALSGVEERVAGLDAGANAYLVKPFDFDELFARLRALRRVNSEEEFCLKIGAWSFYPERRMVFSPTAIPTTLTARENDLLRLFARSPARVFSRDETFETSSDRRRRRPTSICTSITFGERRIFG